MNLLKFHYHLMMMNWHRRSAFSCLGQYDNEGYMRHWAKKRFHESWLTAHAIGQEG